MLLRFLHIPKTAGSTFTNILKRQYCGKGYFSFSGDVASDIIRFRNLPETERGKIELFTGHAPVFTGLQEADDARIITFLRSPISRVKSFCQHVSAGRAPYLVKDFPPEEFSLDLFLESGNEELSNLQTKMLINSGTCTSSALLESISSSEVKDMALDNLYHRISCFGLAEFFDESLIVFSQLLNWSIPVYVSVNKKDPTKLIEFRDHHIDRIMELNSIDLEVYDAAKTRFMNIIESPDFDRAKLKLLRLINSVSPLSMGMEMRYRAKGIWSRMRGKLSSVHCNG